MFRIQNKEKYLQKTIQKVLMRKTKFFRRCLHLNHKDTNIKIIQLRTQEDVNQQINGFNDLPSHLCFYIYHWNHRCLPNINWTDTEMVICHHLKKQILYIFTSLPQNFNNLNLDFFTDIWILKKKTTAFLNLKEGDILFTH